MQMEVILLERVGHLGQMGDVVKVKPGYARNFLLPRKKALRATKENLAYFETQRKRLEAVNLERRSEAEKVGEKMKDFSVVLIRQASEALQLYGSVSARDIATILTDGGFTVGRNQIALNNPIKMVGLHKVPVALHPEVEVTVTINVARNTEEAERQARGEDVTQRREGEDADVEADAEAVFENPDQASDEDQGNGADEKAPG